MSNRGRHRKKIKIDYAKIQKLIDQYCMNKLKMLDFQAQVKTLLYEQRKT